MSLSHGEETIASGRRLGHHRQADLTVFDRTFRLDVLGTMHSAPK
ncbi:MAG: hypothetical protein ABW022_24655 [Actinoplanes sp.]